MKYMMMMNTPTGGAYQIFNWPKQDITNHIQFMKDFNQRLAKAGELVACEGLTGPDQAKLVRAGENGKPITDGVFPETKEFLAGYWIIEVENPERAYQLAAEVSNAPGIGGKPLKMGIELRQIMTLPAADATG